MASKQSPAKKPSAKQAGILATIELLKRYYPDAYCALNYTNPFELLVATILSAQCTDERVNMVTPALFKKYPTPKAMAKAPVESLEELIRSTGFYKNKAKNLKACATTLVEKHHGEVPQSLEALVELGGVGRKTANVVLGNAFNIPSGIVVDTHVTRLANRLGWVKTDNAVMIERQLSKLVPVEDWIMLPHWLISHGRAVCKARKPACSHCFLEETCPKKGV
ncbi:endonuclease III [Bdellovibrio bacteriovorus]|uniref:Endonuclease III n=1 Tax=Bdellovibrio bacteriovorus (strain ATCC 15356 / DSM 50701 / NCIMB 9529 / HD100) TaxID=264462 RepID=Q6MQ89_BDEBA|nr:endonuclease III [Bdellovibrio bacteriovorus]AHZ86672.1 endonuclease III [Bdellovibrio bacteriovorus]BEV67113.1 Endonuclease III [Bdellovibrio bacteriovorus]CAE78558.1 Endo III-related endonuclease [Bdellovibrio bacteriovorus HD100]